MQQYTNQRYLGSSLDDGYFDALISHDDIICVHGALDAVDFIPAGSMYSTSCGRWHDIKTVERGVDLKEQQERDAFIDSLFAEDKGKP